MSVQSQKAKISRLATLKKILNEAKIQFLIQNESEKITQTKDGKRKTKV